MRLKTQWLIDSKILNFLISSNRIQCHLNLLILIIPRDWKTLRSFFLMLTMNWQSIAKPAIIFHLQELKDRALVQDIGKRFSYQAVSPTSNSNCFNTLGCCLLNLLDWLCIRMHIPCCLYWYVYICMKEENKLVTKRLGVDRSNVPKKTKRFSCLRRLILRRDNFQLNKDAGETHNEF